MKVPVAILLSVLCCSLAEGRLVSKCDLMEAFHNLPDFVKQHGLTGNVVARVVCHVELASGFNTSTLNQLNPRTDGDNFGRGKRDTDGGDGGGGGGLFGLAALGGSLSTVQPHTRKRRSFTPLPGDEEVWMLYGLFQLSNHLVCSDGATPSPNICMMDCSKLTDDNIQDDIGCVLNICKHLIENGFRTPLSRELKRMIRLIFQRECRDKTFDIYFKECF